MLKILRFFVSAMILAPGTGIAAQPFRVVIDPGHGGSDYGALFESKEGLVAEKNVTLNLALQVASQLRARGVFVSLTRDSDHEISLPARTALANRLGANVFISIHMNSTQNIRTPASVSTSDPEGIETFILNNTTDASSRRLAHLENSVIAESPVQDPGQADVALILKDLRLDANLSESKRLACQVQSNLVAATSRYKTIPKRNRGVKQALFHVLLGADMPSILVEAGFLNNLHDRKLLTSPQGQSTMSRAIANAVDVFRHKRSATVKYSLLLNKCKLN